MPPPRLRGVSGPMALRLMVEKLLTLPCKAREIKIRQSEQSGWPAACHRGSGSSFGNGYVKLARNWVDMDLVVSSSRALVAPSLHAIE